MGTVPSSNRGSASIQGSGLPSIRLNRSLSTRFLVLGLLCSGLFFSGCGYQDLPRAQNNVEASFAEITNQYKRRADLIPNLVNVVKGFATHEEKVLTEVTEARAKATSMNIDPKNMKAEELIKFQQAQGQLSQALGRLLMVTENYPQIKADANFRDLQAQLEGTENRITVARNRYIGSINEFNNLVSVPPTSWTNGMFYHYEKKPQFTLDDSEVKKNEKPPEVKF